MAKTGIAREAKLVGSRIHQMRKRAKMSVQHFAERTGYTPAFISQIEKGERKPSFEAIMCLAKTLGVSPAAFFKAHASRPTAKKLRQQIRRLLQRCSGQQLLQTYAVLNSMLEPGGPS